MLTSDEASLPMVVTASRRTSGSPSSRAAANVSAPGIPNQERASMAVLRTRAAAAGSVEPPDSTMPGESVEPLDSAMPSAPVEPPDRPRMANSRSLFTVAPESPDWLRLRDMDSRPMTAPVRVARGASPSPSLVS